MSDNEVAAAPQFGKQAMPATVAHEPPFFNLTDLARRWRCSRASVYNRLRGERVLDFATPGHRGQKLVPAEVVRQVEAKHMRVLR